MKLISWNVNGLRAVLKKNFLDFSTPKSPTCFACRKPNARPTTSSSSGREPTRRSGTARRRKGYSGTAIFTKDASAEVTPHIGIAEHDQEGRVLTAEFADFFLVNVYVPNSKRELDAAPYRQQWDRDFLAYLKKLEKKKPVIFCGDLNVAHTEIDLANPKANVHNHGFTRGARRLQRVRERRFCGHLPRI
jgi:exodeoxyribonuclease-3